jgi:hypothetical protein
MPIGEAVVTPTPRCGEATFRATLGERAGETYGEEERDCLEPMTRDLPLSSGTFEGYSRELNPRLSRARESAPHELNRRFDVRVNALFNWTGVRCVF